jgi:hypothetical protein
MVKLNTALAVKTAGLKPNRDLERYGWVGRSGWNRRSSSEA